ncbi:SixA phosphatase family protein [Teredinibacter haidensis]|uniref:SixA phosphatase family protein n=1 Tax=Teredinibacter haidensis TaxID=2731755 RepID=UPI0009489C96|nr:histidine phosphatase family protein [Teredinibacter haidensis]
MQKTKTLYLVRHAKSLWSDPPLSDRERPLNKRGERNAPLMAKRLAEHIQQADGQFPLPQKIVSSPARRALATARIFAAQLNLPETQVYMEECLYFKGLCSILDRIIKEDDDSEAIMLVGHNPDITELHNHLSGIQVEKMPTCAITTLHFQCEHWRQLTQGSGSLVDFDYPKKISSQPPNSCSEPAIKYL